MLEAVKSAPISIAFQAAVTHLEVAMPFIRFRPFKPLLLVGAFAGMEHFLVMGLGNMPVLRSADFFVFEDWL